ncbi:MAG: DUF547 domain-containing protein [Candidatus Sericytochromatia bacterium]
MFIFLTSFSKNKIIIINDYKITSKIDSDIAQSLKESTNMMKAEFYDLSLGKVNYSKIKGSETFENYKNVSANLKNFDLKSLASNEAKKAFWINIYNSLTIHAVIELSIKNSVLEIKQPFDLTPYRFFETVAYNIGGYIFTLDDIEHGILRGNTKKHFLFSEPFNNNDKRKEFMLTILDPRIHFSLVCASKSCPPINTYQEKEIEKQLDLATANFINGGEVILDSANFSIKISKIFDWYKKDFGSNEELLLFIAKYTRNKENKDFIIKNYKKLKVTYLDYNWNLND